MKKLLMIVAVLSLGLVSCNETTEGEVVSTDSTATVSVTEAVTMTEVVTITADSTSVDSTSVE